MSMGNQFDFGDDYSVDICVSESSEHHVFTSSDGRVSCPGRPSRRVIGLTTASIKRCSCCREGDSRSSVNPAMIGLMIERRISSSI